MLAFATTACNDPTFEHVVAAEGYQTASAIRQRMDHGYVLVGTTRANDSVPTDAHLAALDFQGNDLWQRSLGELGSATLTTIEPAVGGGFVVAGGRVNQANGNVDAWLLAIDDAGTERWSQTVPGGGPHRNARSIEQQRALNDVWQTYDGGYAAPDATLASRVRITSAPRPRRAGMLLRTRRPTTTWRARSIDARRELRSAPRPLFLPTEAENDRDSMDHPAGDRCTRHRLCLQQRRWW
ncbi:MAG: hypothetical protein U0610_28220 [bacterium]